MYCVERYWPYRDLQYRFVGDWKGVLMIRLNYLLLTTDNNIWIWSLVCFGVAIVALLLILCCRRFPMMNKIGFLVYLGIMAVVCGIGLLYGGVSTIHKYRRILKDDVKVMGVVKRMEKSGDKYRFFVVFTDERSVQHECRTISRRKDHFAGQKVPVAYYRPDPDQVIVDPSWETFSGPWAAVIAGFVLLIFSSVPLRRAKRLFDGYEDEHEQSQPDAKTPRERVEELQFRIACKNALADGKVTVNEKQKLKMLAKYFKISKPAIKEIIKEEVKIFKQNRKAR
jgi:hypothetical protein